VLRATEATVAPETCCVCGSSTVVYHNYLDLPFCWPCADCQCAQNPCVRTGVNDPAVAGPLAGTRVAVWVNRYFTSPRARDAFLARVARRTERGRR